MKSAFQPRTVAPYKKAGEHDSLKRRLIAQYIARALVRQAFFDLTGYRTDTRLREDGKLWLEIRKELDA